MQFDHFIQNVLDQRAAQHLLRKRQALRVIDSTHVEIDGRRLVNFCSNNYLGLTHHPRIMAAVERALRLHGVGSGSSPLIGGHTNEHAVAEQSLAAWKGTEAALLLPSGYQANHAVVQTLGGASERQSCGVRFLVDKLVHASIIDAVRGSGLSIRVFPHNNLDKLQRLLSDSDADELQVVITESIFSMDGDAANLIGLATLKQRHPFVLVVDEAHGSGVYGRNGSGYAAECGVAAGVDVFVVTLSKALGAAGGAICASRDFCSAVANFGRAYIYSTSVAPFVPAAADAALHVLRDEPQRQGRVRELARRVRSALTGAGYAIPPGDSPILSIVLGSEQAALDAAQTLRDESILAVAIRPPTVARGTSRLRITLSCDHSDGETAHLLNVLVKNVRASERSARGRGARRPNSAVR